MIQIGGIILGEETQNFVLKGLKEFQWLKCDSTGKQMKCKVSLDAHGCTPNPSKMLCKEQINKILEIGKGALKAPPPPNCLELG